MLWRVCCGTQNRPRTCTVSVPALLDVWSKYRQDVHAERSVVFLCARARFCEAVGVTALPDVSNVIRVAGIREPARQDSNGVLDVLVGLDAERQPVFLRPVYLFQTELNPPAVAVLVHTEN